MGALVSINPTPAHPIAPSSGDQPKTTGESAVKDIQRQNEEFDAVYINTFKGQQFWLAQFPSEGKHSHSYSRAMHPLNPRLLTRMTKEIHSLKECLPLHPDSSIFLVQSERQMNLLRAVIIGPKDTPYAYGIFLFDILLTANYPFIPPKVKFRTTGDGKVEFNPHLYSSGHVCLSLLGTWHGGTGNGEKWSPTSTILQVLISLQSLIMVPEPYYNEPGSDILSGLTITAWSDVYKESVQCNTIEHAIVRVLQDPTPEFEEVISKHFSLLGDRILQNVDKWIQESRHKGAILATLRQRLKNALDAVVRQTRVPKH